MERMPAAQRRTAYAALAVGVVAIAWSAIFVRWTEMPGIASAFYRAMFAAMALWPVLLLFGGQSRTGLAKLGRSGIRTAVIGGIFFAGDIGLYNIAVRHTSAGNATFLGNNAPVFVGLISWAMTRKLPSRRFWIALAIALAGALMIVSVDARSFGHASGADALAVVASVCFAFYLMVTERLRGSCDPGVLLALSTSASAAALLVIAAASHISLRIPSLGSFAALAGLALICQIAGYFSLTYALGHLPATSTSVTMLAVAPLTALLALILFGERMTLLQVAGGVLVLVGVWMANRPDTSHGLEPAME
jgi:drug/metabolite transporter (DMT)-like permease